MHDKHKRSIVKTLSWRVIATTTTILVVFLFTRELALSVGVGIVESSSKMIFYYFHERWWNQVSWGRYIFAKQNI